MAEPSKQSTRVSLASNRRAYHEYEVLETLETGIELAGTEVKAARAGGVQVSDGYVRIEKGEAWLYQVRISPYGHGGWTNHEPDRRRRLLLHRSELLKLQAAVSRSGMTLVPLELYVVRNRIKVKLGVCRGKKLWDKRQAIAEREAHREADRAMKAAARSSS